jgi:predicted alpha/beta-fold hydrolase
MPLLKPIRFKPPLVQRNGHLQTILPSLFRKVEGVRYQRQRIETPDNDFLDLDWSFVELSRFSEKLVVVSHGLEGSTNRHYVQGMVKYFNQNGWDALAWNYRSCSGELNLQPRFYHHADTPDLRLVVNHALSQQPYPQVVLVGFSMGGSLSLRYFAEEKELVAPAAKGAIAISAPLDLTSCAVELEKPLGMIYNLRFFNTLKKKVLAKADVQEMPGAELLKSGKIKSLRKFDDHITAPLHGFADAADFYARAGAGAVIEELHQHALLLNALNDPFLGETCYPVNLAKKHPYLHYEQTDEGGHVGYAQRGSGVTYAEHRALQFAEWLLRS